MKKLFIMLIGLFIAFSSIVCATETEADSSVSEDIVSCTACKAGITHSHEVVSVGEKPFNTSTYARYVGTELITVTISYINPYVQALNTYTGEYSIRSASDRSLIVL